MTKAEQETVIRIDESTGLVHVWSASPRVWRQLERQGFVVREDTRHGGEQTGRFYEPVPVADFRFGKKKRVRMTDEQRRVVAERLSKARNPHASNNSGETVAPGNTQRKGEG